VSLAVDFAHQRGVLHRDLKPSNVMIGDFGEVYVLDWGIAKVGGDERGDGAVDADDATQIDDPVALATRAGDVLGTPGYMAPEQVEGRRLDARSDVYSLGCILFEILTQAPLHQGRNQGAVFASTLSDAVRLPSQARPDLDIPPELDAICARATARRREARYPTARALSDALDAYLEGDRDTAQRREMAATHARRAEDALARALAGGDGSEAAHGETMREIGRALALDPMNGAARDVLRRALLDVPDRFPEPVVEALRRRDASTLRLGARLGSYQLALYFAFAPILYAMGFDDWTRAIVPAACLAVGLAATLYGLRRPAIPRWVQLVTLTGMVAAMASLSRIFSPLILVPTLLATNAAVLQIHPRPAMRNLVLGLCLAASVVPIGLEVAGVLEPTFWFEGDRIVVATPGAFRAGPTIVFFVLTTATLIASPALFIGAIRRALSAAVLRVEMNAWRARQLAPSADLEAAAPVASARARRRRAAR
jgi:serine/threonine-protein kinase